MSYKCLYKVKRFLGLTLMIIPFIFSCSEEKRTEHSIDFSYEKLSESIISVIISNYSIIKLETIDDSKINIIKKVVIKNEKIYVLNHQENKQEILIFTMNGDYVNKISKNYEEGNDSLNIVDFDIHPINGNITILNQKLRQLVTFSKDTKFIERFKIHSPAKEIAYGVTNKKAFIVLHTKSSDKDSEPGFEISTYDENYKLLKNFFPYSNKNGYVRSNERTLMKRNGNVMFLREGTKNLYEVVSKKCRNISNFVFSKPVLPADKIYDAFFSGEVDLTNYIYNIDYFESDTTVLTTFSSIDGNYIGIYNKESGSSVLYNMLLDPSCKCGIKIDITGAWLNNFIVQIPRTKISNVMDVLDSDRSKCNNEEIFEIIDNMDPGENPILLLLELKTNM